MLTSMHRSQIRKEWGFSAYSNGNGMSLKKSGGSACGRKSWASSGIVKPEHACPS